MTDPIPDKRLQMVQRNAESQSRLHEYKEEVQQPQTINTSYSKSVGKRQAKVESQDKEIKSIENGFDFEKEKLCAKHLDEISRLKMQIEILENDLASRRESEKAAYETTNKYSLLLEKCEKEKQRIKTSFESENRYLKTKP